MFIVFFFRCQASVAVASCSMPDVPQCKTQAGGGGGAAAAVHVRRPDAGLPPHSEALHRHDQLAEMLACDTEVSE